MSTYIRHEHEEFTRELNAICDVLPKFRMIANQIQKIEKVSGGYHLYSEDAKVASVTMKTLADYSGHRR